VDGPTKFCMIGELHTRKNPWAAITAFQRLKAEHGDKFDAELHLKTTVPGIPLELGDLIPGIFVYDKYWHYDELIKWMHTMTCYVGPSRGEGNLKPPMEFMATGGTVIATNWSGPENWLHPDFTYALNYKLIPMDPHDADSPKDASADIEHLQELMWHVHTHRTEVADKGMKAAEWIRWSNGWDKCVGRVIKDLEARLTN